MFAGIVPKIVLFFHVFSYECTELFFIELYDKFSFPVHFIVHSVFFKNR